MWKRKPSKPSEDKAIKVSPTHIKPVARPANRPAAHSSAVKKAGEISVEKPAVVNAEKAASEKSSGSTVKIERSGVVAGNAPGAPKVGEVIAAPKSDSSLKAEAAASKKPKVERPRSEEPKAEDTSEVKKPKVEERPLSEKSKPKEKPEPSAFAEAQKVQSTQIEKKQETEVSTPRLSRALVFETTVGVIFSLAIAGLLGFFMMGGSF